MFKKLSSHMEDKNDPNQTSKDKNLIYWMRPMEDQIAKEKI